MERFLTRWIISSLALWVAISIVPGIHGHEDWIAIVVLGLIFTFVNSFIRPLAKLVGCIPIILTFGLFTLVINAFLFWLTGQLGLIFGVGFTTDGFWSAFLGSLVVSLVSLFLGLFVREEDQKRLRSRHNK